MHPLKDAPPPLPIITLQIVNPPEPPEALITEDGNTPPDDPITTEDGVVITTE